MRERRMTVLKWLKIIIAYVIFVIMVFVFKELAENVMDESTMDWDVAILRAIKARSTPSGDEIVMALTDLAGPIFIPIVAVILIGYFIWIKEAYNGLYVALTLGGTFLVNTLLKLYYQRSRPDLWELLVEERSFSFPSGHAMISMALALTLIVLVFHSYWRLPALLLGLAYVLGIGFSRLYLGVHYPTDILAGWLVSLVWVGVVTRIMMRRNERFRYDTLN